ncbi:hypothetical protein PCH_Pc22g01030 [Penicillium rubens Wisconsin 54-1255]|uniref:Uncharacterized protein n=1 Tax=Penicillium rubens (strain ATCC 28089 / DSM 1075 / NRRL 1951 / Wisconsin 54-1255) TaxID=500485 RepID=B6HPN8_PENRW|nr:hypothetical protein PCH_Pc22g01030 [Penicillium rubens Wisconsin 54-1255]
MSGDLIQSLASVQFTRALDPGVGNGIESPRPWQRFRCDRILRGLGAEVPLAYLNSQSDCIIGHYRGGKRDDVRIQDSDGGARRNKDETRRGNLMYHSSTMSNPPFRARHEERSKIIPGFTIGIYFGGKTQSPLFLSIGTCVSMHRDCYMSDVLHMATSTSTGSTYRVCAAQIFTSVAAEVATVDGIPNQDVFMSAMPDARCLRDLAEARPPSCDLPDVGSLYSWQPEEKMCPAAYGALGMPGQPYLID